VSEDCRAECWEVSTDPAWRPVDEAGCLLSITATADWQVKARFNRRSRMVMRRWMIDRV
jgi:hypothetical protein